MAKTIYLNNKCQFLTNNKVWELHYICTPYVATENTCV